jgi:hypothetical protein
MLHGPHRYLRAYLAGVAVPTAFLVIIVSSFVAVASAGLVAWSLAALLIFPMAVVPNLWGLWNMVYIAVSKRHAVNIGVFGAILPCVLAPAGYTIATALGHPLPLGLGVLSAAFALAVLVYFLVWRHVVHYLNESLELE